MDLSGLAFKAHQPSINRIQCCEHRRVDHPHSNPDVPGAAAVPFVLNHAFLQTPDILADNFTLAVAVVIVMFWNFFANRYWTYGDVD